MEIDYIYGRLANRPELPPLSWNPDSKKSINPHMLICGGSGAGKTTLLLSLAAYLALRNKQIFIFDLKGDMQVKDKNGNIIGNYIEFTAWNSEYGINPFEFDTGVAEEELREIVSTGNISDSQRFKIQNSGPKVQVERIVEIIKKNFLPNMGTNQKDILTFLLADTYISKGFRYDDINTWLQDLPSLSDTLDLILKIKSYTINQKAVNIHSISEEFILDAQQEIINYKSTNLPNVESETTSEISADFKDRMLKLFEEYLKKGVDKFTEDAIIPNNNWFKEKGIDIEKYTSKDALRTIEKLSSYINALVSSGVFHSARPPVKAGLNIINISGLDVAIQRFIVDVWLGKVFKSCKIRGTYSERSNKSRGEKCDTYVIIDESKLIAGTSRDKNDPYSYLNRIATEARGFGFGLIVAAQSAEHFPPEFLKNFDAQIVLNTGVADFETVRKSFSIDKELLKFTQQSFGNALIKTGVVFNKVKLEYRQKESA
ncbi:MAG: DUF87 domain-containing protein [Arcobacteraceae bacterium]|jgi:GTPase SAR1 family protein|nr:DUF87 domain-containing protein [Arcobacteraceae bacterium]